MSSEFSEIEARFETFIEECEWEDYHTPKSVAISISIEANELLETF